MEVVAVVVIQQPSLPEPVLQTGCLSDDQPTVLKHWRYFHFKEFEWQKCQVRFRLSQRFRDEYCTHYKSAIQMSR